MTGKWCYSHDEEHFYGDFDTKEEAIEEAIYALDETGADFAMIWVGEEADISIHLCAHVVLDQLAEDAYEEAGEHAEKFLQHVEKEHEEELEKELNQVIKTWMKKHKYEPTFYTVKNVEEIKVPRKTT